MLEQQQAQLVAGLRELYQLLQSGRGWPGAPLHETQGGHPLTHDILERLGLLNSPSDSNSHCEEFEEDFSKLQRRLLKTDTAASRSRASTNSNSDSDPGFASSASSIETPPLQPIQFTNPFVQKVAPPTPQSPIRPQSQLNRPVKEFPLMMPSITQTDLNPANLMRSQWSIPVPPPAIHESLHFFGYDEPMPMDMDGPLAFNDLPGSINSPLHMTEFTTHEVDFSDFVPL